MSSRSVVANLSDLMDYRWSAATAGLDQISGLSWVLCVDEALACENVDQAWLSLRKRNAWGNLRSLKKSKHGLIFNGLSVPVSEDIILAKPTNH